MICSIAVGAAKCQGGPAPRSEFVSMNDICSNSHAKRSSIDCIDGVDRTVSISTKQRSPSDSGSGPGGRFNRGTAMVVTGLEFLSQISTHQRSALTIHSIGQRLAALWVNMLYEGQAVRVGSAQACALTHAASKRTMIRKSILVTALLLLATVQTLAANCDLRCSLMPDSSVSHECGHPLQTAPGNDRAIHCHGMPMNATPECSSILSGPGCGVTICRARLDAINKNSSPNQLTSRPISFAIPGLPVHSQTEGTLRTSSARRSADRRDTSAPLELRPGSSLRI
jgi:hypothetical protein